MVYESKEAVRPLHSLPRQVRNGVQGQLRSVVNTPDHESFTQAIREKLKLISPQKDPEISLKCISFNTRYGRLV